MLLFAAFTPRPLEPLPPDSTLAEVIVRCNELLALITEMGPE